MKLVNVKKQMLHIALGFILFSSGFLTSVYAQELRIISAEEAKIDTSAIREDTNFTVPKRIVITPIFQDISANNIPFEQIYRGIYFYTLEILGFNDTPFHYFISEEGELFRGNKGGDERRVNIEGFGQDSIVIGYIVRKGSLLMNTRALNSAKELVLEVANNNSIPPENISIIGTEFVRNEELRTVSLRQKDLFGSWQVSENEIRNYISANYAPKPKSYSLDVISLTLPEGELIPGEVVDINIELENTSFNGFYGLSDSEIILTKSGDGSSVFYVNGSWYSNTQVGIMQENDILLPLDTNNFTFQVKVPLFVGEISETFVFRNRKGEIIQADPVTLTLNVARTDRAIVEILPTETGTLNVRQTPSSVGNLISQVSPGERFFVISNAGNGWIEIDLGNGQTGWIASWYTKEI
ncbi:MAG: hypothetical protein Kow0081_1370 [Candidatus Dojkabacteria bacterium]